MGQQHNQPGFTDQSLIRNFCIIAHIDHGKSTVADRILQLSGIVPEREMRDRFLDRMDIEQERGITIKSQAVRVPWTFDGTEYTLGMIDTPGHVDFTYEVSRALAACEGAVLLVDATQGIEAQTLSNLYMAIDHDLAIIPVLNKIDLPSAEPDKHAEEIAGLIGCDPSEVLRVSGKTGEGVTELLDRIAKLNDLAAARGQTLAEMALAWLLAKEEITSVLVGASRPSQILDNIKAVENTGFTAEELAEIDRLSV